MPQPNAPEERILDIAAAVDALVADVGNLARFREQIKVFGKELANRPDQDGPFRPGPSPSQAAMVTLLAYVHDDFLPHCPAICVPPIANMMEVIRSGDASNWAILKACSGFMETKDIAPSRAATLDGYLNRVWRWLEEEARHGDGAAGRRKIGFR
jgi:hypothetical protein